jgi:hypothetical protein
MVICLLVLVAASGCGGVGKLHTVSGKVSGEFKEGDMVVFTRTGGGKTTQNLDIRGTIKADGTYKMQTSLAKSLKDGVPEGTYTVTIAPLPPAMASGGDPAAMAGGGAAGPLTGAGPPADVKASPDEVKVPGGPYDLTLSK